MEFTIEFYENPSGRCPVEEFLDELKGSDPDDFAAVMAGLARLRTRQYHRSPLSKAIGDDLFEMRHIGKLNTRMLLCAKKPVCPKKNWPERWEHLNSKSAVLNHHPTRAIP